jgi:hypothetical protein
MYCQLEPVKGAQPDTQGDRGQLWANVNKLEAHSHASAAGHSTDHDSKLCIRVPGKEILSREVCRCKTRQVICTMFKFEIKPCIMQRVSHIR